MSKSIFLSLGGALLLLALAGCGAQRSFTAEVSHATVEGAAAFAPSVKSVVGSNGTIKVTNKLDKEHGFSISELEIAKVVPPGESILVELKELKPVDYEFFCQLHDVKTKKGQHQRGLLRVAR